MANRLCRIAVFGAVSALLLPGSSASAACINPPVSEQAIAQFRSNPAALLNPTTDGRAVETAVRDLVASDATLTKSIVSLAAGAPSRLKTAIAAGLAQAATACTTIDVQAAMLIQQAVAALPDGEFQTTFAAIAGDLSTAATAAAAASASSSTGSVIIKNPNRSARAAQGPGGGGGVSLLTQITSGGRAIVAVDGPARTAKSVTSGDPVSATR
ncbi:hypothetical protein DNX69_06420 [Rhodopseudomonas palustris]|uniref:Uncharacterized protein n=1 Tax=Rhodopseudomonas palustris TaxID=1076 RepID=A0A323UK00_RHOPL|nr:hypothetical protein [Rhodopseudomonas palustris]PZA12824.1 hypothetical protein DNX69_06420 [Rhodopseudomonas palustris]